MTHLTHLTDYFSESSRVPRTHGTREKVANKCVKSVKSVNFATEKVLGIKGFVLRSVGIAHQLTQLIAQFAEGKTYACPLRGVVSALNLIEAEYTDHFARLLIYQLHRAVDASSAALCSFIKPETRSVALVQLAQTDHEVIGRRTVLTLFFHGQAFLILAIELCAEIRVGAGEDLFHLTDVLHGTVVFPEILLAKLHSRYVENQWCCTRLLEF